MDFVNPLFYRPEMFSTEGYVKVRRIELISVSSLRRLRALCVFAVNNRSEESPLRDRGRGDGAENSNQDTTSAAGTKVWPC